MEKVYKMLIINPGSTSTKIAVYENQAPLFEEKLAHSIEELAHFNKLADQLDFRREVLETALKGRNISFGELDGIVSRGGLTRPVESGIYEINELMVSELKTGKYGEHASNLASMIAFELSKKYGLPCWIADPVVVDEMQDIARFSGIPQLQRKSIFHALNQKAVSRRVAGDMGKKYDECNFVVAHLGGGISVAAHKKGKCIDVNNALGGEGPYSPERAGGVSAFGLIDMCFSGDYTKDDLKKLLVGKGGLTAYLGTNDGREIEAMIKNGDKNAEAVFNGMAYQVAKEIGAAATVLHGELDAIILTGGLAHNKDFVTFIENMVKYIGSVVVYPGEDELLALAESGYRVLSGQENARKFRTCIQ
ncbi:MAG: butyrate kinase [Defluviitaleaceae bacterium]|nr:butyrate kinase [Defluviitaleaceae bacterium]